MTRNECIGELIGGDPEKYEEVDLVEGEMGWGEFMQIKVIINITKPLLRGNKLNIGLTKHVWIRLAYEHLSDFCYSYVCIEYNHKD